LSNRLALAPGSPQFSSLLGLLVQYSPQSRLADYGIALLLGFLSGGTCSICLNFFLGVPV
jgi:hypothetical protein